MSYDPSNIFGKILRGEIPAHKVYEDDTALVMMDIFPQSRGHTLIVPKAPSRNLLDADPAALSAVIPLVQKVAKYSDQVRDQFIERKRTYKLLPVTDKKFVAELQWAADWLTERKVLPEKVTVADHLANVSA